MPVLMDRVVFTLVPCESGDLFPELPMPFYSFRPRIKLEAEGVCHVFRTREITCGEVSSIKRKGCYTFTIDRAKNSDRQSIN